MAPADISKEGSSYDLPLAMGILTADEKVPKDGIDSYVLIGELSLDGTLQPVKGALSIALRAREEGFKGLVLPVKNAREVAVVGGLDVYGMEKIGDVVDFFDGIRKFEPVKADLIISYKPVNKNHSLDQFLLSFNSITDINVYKNEEGIRILEITFATNPTLECVIKNFNEFYYNRIKTKLNDWMKNFSYEDLAKDNLYKQRGYKI